MANNPRTPPQASLTDAVPSARAGNKPREIDTQADRERRNPFFRWLVHLGAPMVISLVLHVSLLGAMALYTVYTVQAKIDVGDYNASLVNSDADLMKSAFDFKQPELEQLPEEKPEPEALTELDELTELETPDVSTEVGANDDGMGIGEGALTLLGTGEGAGESGEGGFGGSLGAGGGAIGRANFWGLNITANKLVFVIDYSGSIIVAADDVKRELKRSIGALKPFQSFSVVLFYGGGANEQFHVDAFSPKLEAAQEDSRKRFFAWIDRKEPQGGTEPVAAIKRALAMKPEAILFMSDGYFDDAVLSEIANANKLTRAKIFTFAFEEDLLSYTGKLPPKVTDGARRMQKIAEQNRGQSHIVTGNDLKR